MKMGRSVQIPSPLYRPVSSGRFIGVVATVIILFLSWCATPVKGQEQGQAVVPSKGPLVAVLDFEFAAPPQYWWAAESVGRSVAELLTEGLVNDGTYRLVERKWLSAILEEQKVSGISQANEQKIAGAVGLLGAQYLIVGAVTRYGSEKETNAATGLGLLYVGKRKAKALVAITARVVDVKSGEVMVSAKGEGTSTREGTLAVSPVLLAGYSKSPSEYRDMVLGEATELAVKQVVEKLSAARQRLPGP